MDKKLIHQLLSHLLMLLVPLSTVLTFSCSDDEFNDSYRTFTGMTIKDFVEQDDYTMFKQALERAEKLSLMSSYGKYTVFVPTDKAMAAYVKEQGFSSFEEFLDSPKELGEMVLYHIIDGEVAGRTYTTVDFKGSNLETKNMAGRYIYLSLGSDGATWIVNSQSGIISSDNKMINGVVHVVDHVLRGNNDIISDFIMGDSRFTLYGHALKITGLEEKLGQIEDETYVMPDDNVSPEYPKKRLYGFTALLETDKVLADNGITSIDDMRRYAEEKYPEGGGKEDNDSTSSLYRFVAYHIVPMKLTSTQLCPVRGLTVNYKWYDETWQTENFRDGKYSTDNYLFPLAENTIINVQQFSWRENNNLPVFNDPRNPYDPQYSTGVLPDAVSIDKGNSDIDCLNGSVHALTGMLYYREDVYHKRLRMDFALFFPEMWNNDIRSAKRSLPYGYLANLKYEAKDGVKVRYWLEYGGHSYYWGDNFDIWGRNNYDIEIGPIPSGSYEVRIGYHVRMSDYGVVQYYLDGQPCGIPLDQTIEAHKSTEIGWNQVYWWMVEDCPGTGWRSGRESADDYYGFDTDKSMHNLGYMRAGDSYSANELRINRDADNNRGTARNDAYSLRRVLGMVTWSKTEKHTFTISNLMDKAFDLDYIEFIPKDLIENEDIH